jgi:hypothetical protein
VNAASRAQVDVARRTVNKTAMYIFLGGQLMSRVRVTIRSAMALVLSAGGGFAALRDPSMWWVGAVVGCLIGLLLTACIGAIYWVGRERAFWLGIVIFGGGYLLLIEVLSRDGTGNPVAFINRVLDTPTLDLRSTPTAGVKVLAETNGELRPASVLQVDRTKGAYYVRFDGWADDFNAWLNAAQVKLRSGDD